MISPSIQSPYFFRDGNYFRIREIIEICACLNLEVLSVREGLVHSIRILEAPAVFSSASVAQMLAAASVKVMDALFGFVARNDAEWSR